METDTIGTAVYWLESVDSTNAELARRLARDSGIPEGTLVVARDQRQGKGMAQNRWESEPGLNLTFSFLVRPGFLEAPRQFYLNMAVSLGMCHAVRDLLPPGSVKIKWPNDIYAGKRKVAGILIQTGISGNRMAHAIVGVGLNVNQTVFSPEIPNPGSLCLASGLRYDLEEVLQTVVSELNARYDRIRKGNLAGCAADYRSAMYGFGQWLRYSYKGRELKARIKGVEETGELILEKEGQGRIVCGMKEIEYLV